MRDYLVELETDKTGDQRGSGCDGRDDLSSDLLRRMPVSRRDAVVRSSQVRRSSDEVDVEVRVVVLLELDGVQTVADQR